MSSQGVPENTEWEKEIQQKLNKIYVEKLEIDILNRKGERGYDVVVRNRKTLRRYTIEEKIIRHVWDNLSVELIQDIKTNNLGWIYTCKADILHWVMCNNGEPKVIYRVLFLPFKEWYLENCKNYNPNTFRIEPEGWGLTLHQLIPPQDIPDIKTLNLGKT